MKKEIERHPLSSAFPSMGDAEFLLLVKDISEHGLIEPVVVLDGMILDGWHRYNACIETGADCSFTVFAGGDPAEYAWSKNAPRRNLSASQRAAAIVKISEWRERGRDEIKCAPGAHLTGEPINTPTSKDMAKTAGVSTRTIVQAKKAERDGLGDDVRDGKISLKKATAKPKKPKKPTPEPPAQPPDTPVPNDDADMHAEMLADAMDALRDENENLRNQVATMLFDGTCEEKAEYLDRLNFLTADNNRLEIMNRGLIEARNRVMLENVSLRKQGEYAARKLKAIEKRAS